MSKLNYHIDHFFQTTRKRCYYLILLISIGGFSQKYNGSLDASVAEKVYLQLHSNAYAMDQDIWFKAIVTGTENHMPPGIVESVELIKYAKFFTKQYLTVFPETHPLDAPTLGHIISVNTKGGVGIHGTDRPAPGTLESTIAVFSPEKEFYAPKYNGPAPDSQKPDLRSLIHWVPNIKTDQNGRASVSFYNGDIAGDYIIVVEAISRDGHIGYQEKRYRVGEGDP